MTLRTTTFAFGLAGMILGCAALLGLAQQPQGKNEHESLEKHLVRPKPLSPAEALKSFQIENGFRIDLAASEPDVFSPIVMAWDEDGRLYVAENIDYPEATKPGKKPLGRIRLLIDSKGDGVYDRSTVFADGLQWPSSIVPWKGGIFVTAAPQLLYLKDTDGDGKADIRRVIYDGFGTEVAERVVNNLRCGPDNNIYGVTSGNGGEILPALKEGFKPMTIRGRDIRLDPVTEKIDLLAGSGTFGNAFDDWGNRFTSTPGMPLRQYVLPGPYLARNPYLAVGAVTFNSGAGKRTMHSISPPESWRVVRQKFWDRWVNKSYDFRAARFPKEELTPSGFVTGAAGVEIYRGTAFPVEYHGDSFTAEPAGNVLIRLKLKLKPNGVLFDGIPAGPKDHEFLASTDNWFRPVNVANGPDGCLYLCDMYREVIEFPSAIPDDILKIIDVTNGRDRGRIWRIRPANFKRPTSPKLSKTPSAELVALLEHPDSWYRETAQRLLFERQDKSVARNLAKLVAESKSAQGRLHALCTLEGLKGLDEPTLLQAMNDTHPAVRSHAVRLSEGLLARSAPLRQRAVQLAEDRDITVRFQAAFSLGAAPREATVQQALAGVFARDGGDRWMITAVFSSIGDQPGQFFVQLLHHEPFLKTAKSADVLSQLLGMIGARQKPAETTAILRALVQPPFSERPALQQAALVSLADALAKTGKSLETVFRDGGSDLKAVRGLFDQFLEKSHRVAVDAKSPEDDRLVAIRVLRHGDFDSSAKTLVKLFSINESLEVQLATIQSLAGFNDPEVGKLLVQHWQELSPRARNEAVESLFRDERRLDALLNGLEKKIIRPVELPLPRQQALRKQKNQSLRQRAEKLFASVTPPNRREVLEKYQAVFKLTGDAQRGGQVFAKSCAACHRLGKEGKSVGPDLVMVQKQSPEQLLIAILDPNREVDRQYLNYVVITKNGRTLSGIIVAETANSLTLRRGEGVEDTLLRADIDELTSSGQSLMPEGLEQQIDAQQMADVMRFLLPSAAFGTRKER